MTRWVQTLQLSRKNDKVGPDITSVKDEWPDGSRYYSCQGWMTYYSYHRRRIRWVQTLQLSRMNDLMGPDITAIKDGWPDGSRHYSYQGWMTWLVQILSVGVINYTDTFCNKFCPHIFIFFQKFIAFKKSLGHNCWKVISLCNLLNNFFIKHML